MRSKKYPNSETKVYWIEMGGRPYCSKVVSGWAYRSERCYYQFGTRKDAQKANRMIVEFMREKAKKSWEKKS